MIYLKSNQYIIKNCSNDDNLLFVILIDRPRCPICNARLKKYGTFKRKVITLSGLILFFILPKLYCSKCKMRRYHRTYIPKYMIPYKHYGPASIFNAITKTKLTYVECENSTIRNWSIEYLGLIQKQQIPDDEVFSKIVGHLFFIRQFGTNRL